MPSSIWGLFWSTAFGTSVVSDGEAAESLTPGRQDLETPNYHGAFTYEISLSGAFASDYNSNSCNGRKNT